MLLGSGVPFAGEAYLAKIASLLARRAAKISSIGGGVFGSSNSSSGSGSGGGGAIGALGSTSGVLTPGVSLCMMPLISIQGDLMLWTTLTRLLHGQIPERYVGRLNA